MDALICALDRQWDVTLIRERKSQFVQTLVRAWGLLQVKVDDPPRRSCLEFDCCGLRIARYDRLKNFTDQHFRGKSFFIVSSLTPDFARNGLSGIHNFGRRTGVDCPAVAPPSHYQPSEYHRASL
ncbi:MAG: hypothetical protein GIW97_08195 [Candidatus Eremiobacteraeota bacterium]|nr:hypothetical protein [Candidatus Eremiobacteraeota bacterium]